MESIKRSLLAAAVVGGLCGGKALVRAAQPTNAPAVQKLDDDDHWKYKHMHHAMEALREARKEMDDAEDIFHGHEQDAIDHVDKAIHEIEVGLKEQHDEAVLPAALPSPSNLDERFPHVRHALERLKDAKTELESADPIFAGHRDEAISHIDKAMHQLEDGMHEAGE